MQNSKENIKDFNTNEIVDAFDSVDDYSGGKEAMKESVFQTKLIKCFIEDEEFSQQILDILYAKHFDNIQHKILFQHMSKYIAKYNFSPNYETFNKINRIVFVFYPFDDLYLSLQRQYR